MDTNNLSNMSVLVYDVGGLSVEHAVRLGKDFKTVYYFSPWAGAYPKFSSSAIGWGMEGIKNVIHPFDVIDKVDLICFFDIGEGDKCKYLRNHGYRVYGAGEGEWLEDSRYDFRKLQAKLGLPAQDTKLHKGVDRLRNYLKTNKDKYVKLDIFRGDVESFYSKDYESSELMINELEESYGPLKNEFSFMTEDPVKSEVEIGIDGFFSREFIYPTLMGYEKGTPYIGKYVYELPKCLKPTAKALTPVLKKLDYRGALSTEEFVVSKTRSFLIDITARYPFPLSYCYTESIENYSELIWGIAEGNPPPLIPLATYVACFPLEIDHAEHHWVRLIFDNKVRNKMKLKNCCKVSGKYYAIKGQPNSIIVCVLGESINGLIKDIKELIKDVDAHEISKSGLDKMDDIQQEIESGRDMGIDF